MNLLELQQTYIDCYELGANYCRTFYEKGGVCTYIHKSLNFVNIDFKKYCKDKDFEVCTIKLYLNSEGVCIITIYRAPSGNFYLFITKLDTILRNLYVSTRIYYLWCHKYKLSHLQ
jgi:hypothetical protein